MNVRRAIFAAVLALAAGSVRADGPRPWRDYRTIMWIADSAYKRPENIPLFFQRLREMGVNTAMVADDDDARIVLANHFPYYVENIVNRGLCLKWNSNVRDWDQFVTRWSQTGRPDAALVREYCLDDPAYLESARRQVRRVVQKNRANQPLAYDLRDELSVTISANPFDYDFNPLTLAAFREYLKSQYPTLAALNAEWGTSFSDWAQVKPFTTDQIKNRMSGGGAMPRGKTDWRALENVKFDPAAARRDPLAWNFSPWADFRTYMDISLSRTLGELRQTARALDPATPVGIEGAQMPDAFGGYDLWRLSQALDWVEPYDVGDSREIFGSFMPGKPMLTTVFESDADHARRRLWHLLLEGDKGCIIWWSEDRIDASADGCPLTDKGKAIAPVLREMTSPLATVFLRAVPQYDPIFLHYSQPSIQVDWLLESTGDGATWLRRFSSFEADHNRMIRVRDAWLKAFEDLGFSPRFISSEQIEAGALHDARVLVLPTSLALSDHEATAISAFIDQGHLLLADGTPGLFDAHGKLRAASPLDGRFPPATSPQRAFAAGPANVAEHNGDITDYARQRLGEQSDAGWLDWIADHCPLRPPVRIETIPPAGRAAARTRVRRYRLGEAMLLAFERNIEYQISEQLKQAGGNEALEKPIDLQATLDRPAHIYDLRSGQYLGLTASFRFRLDPWQPSLFAALPRRVEAADVLPLLVGESDKTE